MTTTLGHTGQQAHKRCEYLALSFSPLSAPLRSRWRNNGVSADFLGDYVTTFLPTSSNTGGGNGSQSDIRHAVTYIANEFLENAMKYHEHDVDIPIGLRLELTSDEISVSVSNCIGAGLETRYRAFIEKTLTQDPGELLFRQLEENSAGIEPGVSCLGLLTIITDYGARLGWRFEPHADYPQLMIVTTSAILPIGKMGVATV
jgi:hypothetical protein